MTPMDTRDSNVFLDKLLAMRQGFKLERVADCGAGIGRVAKNLLLPRCQYVDLVEQSPRLLAAAPAYLSNVSITGFLGGIAANGSAAASTSSGADGVMECASVFHRIGSEYAQALSSRVRLLNIGLQVLLFAQYAAICTKTLITVTELLPMEYYLDYDFRTSHLRRIPTT